MRIIGGTYYEHIIEPTSERLAGSAVRAAAALGRVIRTTVSSFCDMDSLPLAEGAAEIYGFDLDLQPRERAIGFRYRTPISEPLLYGRGQPRARRTVILKDEPAIVFGLLEADVEVEAAAIVYDPQEPHDTTPIDRSRLRAERFAVVGNASEISALGGSPDSKEAAHRLLKVTNAEVVVVKRGCLGALVVGADGHALVDPYRTSSVWPIGSGDVFTAVFGWAWLDRRMNAVVAAELASMATAAWSGTQVLPLTLSGEGRAVLTGAERLRARMDPVSLYLAGPFFSVAERWLVDLARHALTGLGGQVFSPMHDVGLGGDEVATADRDALERSQAVLALLDGADAGTLFEAGYAHAKGIPVVGYTEHPEREECKMLRGLDIAVGSDLSTAVYHSLWAGMTAV